MPTKNFTLRLPSDLRADLEARAKDEGRDLGPLIIAACRAYVLGEPDDAYRRVTERATAAEAERDQLREQLAAAGSARRAALKSREAAFAEALKAATPQNPATAPRMAALSGFSRDWSKSLLVGSAAAGCAVFLGDGRYAGVPGRDMRDDIEEIRAHAQHGARRDESVRKLRGVTSPAHTRPIASAAASGARAGKNAARENGAIAGVMERAEALGAPLVVASDLPSAATAVFQEPGARKVVTAPVPEVPAGKPRGRNRTKCPHRLQPGAWCKTCQQPK